MPPRTDAARRARWAGVPAAERRAERRSRLLAAGLDLLGTEGVAGTTVRGVCQRARLNPRYFYESFASLDDLAVAVYDGLVDRLTAEVAAAQATAGPDRRARARAAVERIVGFVDEDRRRARVLYVEALGHPALSRHRIDTGRRLVELVARDAGAGPLARLAAAIVVGGLNEALMAWLDGRIGMDRDRLVDDATALFLALEDAAGGIARARSAMTPVTPVPGGKGGQLP